MSGIVITDEINALQRRQRAIEKQIGSATGGSSLALHSEYQDNHKRIGELMLDRDKRERPQIYADEAALALVPQPPEGGNMEAGEAFATLVAARKKHVEAVSAYNARRVLVLAERERGNHSMRLDNEYISMSEAQSNFIKTAQDVTDAVLASPIPARDTARAEEVCSNYCQYAKDVAMLEHSCADGCYEKHGGPIGNDNLARSAGAADLVARLTQAAVDFEAMRAHAANAEDADCEPYYSEQREMEEASQTAIEAAEFIAALTAPVCAAEVKG